MKLHGTLVSNLRAAVKSANRLHGQRVYPETLYHWEKLLDETYRKLRGRVVTDEAELRLLATQLEGLMVGRRVIAGRPDTPTIDA